jgi:signal transduction histidine kinase
MDPQRLTEFRRALVPVIAFAALWAVARVRFQGPALLALLPPAAFTLLLPIRSTRLLRASASAAFVLWFAVILLEAWQPSSSFPAALLVLFVFPSLALLLIGSAAGSVAFVAVIVAVAAYFAAHPAAGPRELNIRVNFTMCLLTTQIFLWGFHVMFRRLGKVLEAQSSAIAGRLEERAKLTKMLVADIKSSLEGITPRMIEGRLADLATLRGVQQRLAGILREAQRALTVKELPQQETLELPDFRARMMRWILIITSVQLLLIGVRIYLTKRGSYVPAFAFVTVNVLLLLAFQRFPGSRSRVALVFSASACFTILFSMQPWGFQVPPPGTVYIATIAYHAVLIGGRYSAFGIAATNLAMVGYVAARGAASSPAAALYLATVALAALVMQTAWAELQIRVSSALDTLHERSRELTRLEAFRTRLCGTLFHDVANPVQAMGMLLSLGDDVSAKDARLLERLKERVSQLIGAASQVLEGEGAIPEARLRAMEVDTLFQEASELFQYRLRDKLQSLVCSANEPLRVRAAPELLRDSALANLLSNAIKFSPPGAAIELSARRNQDRVEISVRDHGPGWPEDLREHLKAGSKISSTPGSSGETGLGLGLTLASEHLVRMGGRLTLRDAEGGGGEAVIMLPAA